MIPAAIIERAAADGVQLSLSPAGTIRAVGPSTAIARWTAVIRDHKPGIVAALQAPANDPDLYQRWTITLPNRVPFAVLVVPAATVAQMRLQYPTATSIVASLDHDE